MQKCCSDAGMLLCALKPLSIVCGPPGVNTSHFEIFALEQLCQITRSKQHGRVFEQLIPGWKHDACWSCSGLSWCADYSDEWHGNQSQRAMLFHPAHPSKLPVH